MNGLICKAGDIGSACLEAKTKEKVFFVAGKSLGPLEGHTLVIIKALHELRSSGAHFHEQLADVLRNEGFKPTLADADLWIRDAGDIHEHACICVDDAIFVGKEPDSFCHNLKKICGCKLNGVKEPTYHLGGNFGRDRDSTLHHRAKTHINKIMQNHERKNGSKPRKRRKFSSLLARVLGHLKATHW